ncbi:MAG: nuclear transport factor 2 family protein [Bryobacteraceae bacterium]
MKRLIKYSLAVFFALTAVSFAGPDKATIMAKENSAWQAFKDKKSDEFSKIMDPNFVAIAAQGMNDKAKEIAEMQKWDLKSFAISDFNAVTSEPDVVVTSYKVAIEGTMDSEDVSGTYNCASVWKSDKSGGWTAILHSTVSAAPATKE